jgi:hypothetical protein
LFLLAADLKESFYFLLMHHRALDLTKLFVVAKANPRTSTGAYFVRVMGVLSAGRQV